jgi:hypothetical protein
MASLPFFSATRCGCGFERLEDEEVSDHLLTVFVPDDGVGPDGQVHQEENLRTCSCGFTAVQGAEFDTHLLAIFTPANCVDRTGVRHSPLGGTAPLASAPLASGQPMPGQENQATIER